MPRHALRRFLSASSERLVRFIGSYAGDPKIISYELLGPAAPPVWRVGQVVIVVMRQSLRLIQRIAKHLTFGVRFMTRPQHALALLLMLSIFNGSTVAAPQTIVGATSEWTSGLATWLRAHVPSFLTDAQSKKLTGSMPAKQIVPGVAPHATASRGERAARAVSLRINPRGDVVLHVREPMVFSAIPLDAEGTAIHGLHAEWESNNRLVVFVKKNGQAVAGKPGNAVLTARAGNKTETVRVTVVGGTDFGRKKKVNSTRAHRQVGKNLSSPAIKVSRKASTKRQHLSVATGNAKLVRAGMTGTGFCCDPDNDPLPDLETSSLYLASNAVGNPPGKGRMHILPIPENGNQNFTFALPVFGLPGRGLDASLSLVHNSQVWNKSVDPSDSSTQMTYDVDTGWPGPGFRLGYGQLEDQGTNGFTLTGADGTRHALVNPLGGDDYDTNDGTFIHYTGDAGSGTLYYPDGTRVTYGAGGGGLRLFPTKITDRNGNYILITYAGASGEGPKISTIQDTLERYVEFHYASSGDLVAITTPGLTGDLQVMRFYYDNVTIGSSGLFDSGYGVNAPSTIHTLRYVYLPTSADGSGAHIGYRFDYNTYGTMYQTTQFRGMTVSTGSLSSAGTVTEGTNTTAAVSTYDYPSSASSLGNVPTYTHRTDEWAGRTASSAPVYTFANSSTTGFKISTVTAPDGTIVETRNIDDPGNWDDGLVSETKVGSGSGTPTWLTDTKYDWEHDSAFVNPRIYQIRNTDVAAGLTKATVLSYTTHYNNVSVVSERAFTTDGSASDTKVRRTETTYLDYSTYTNRHLLHLPSSVQVFAGTSTTPIARVDYVYDSYGLSHTDLTHRDDIVMHDPAFDPFQETVESNCHWTCFDWDDHHHCIDLEWLCDEYNPYDAGTDYRGNVTLVKSYPDIATADPDNPATYISHSTKYDIAGNVMSADVDCCQQKSFSYSSDYDYAYPTSVTRGSGGLTLTSSATYDSNTGLPATATDENSQVTHYYYNADSLRTNHIDNPTGGGSTYFYYGDGLWADVNGHYHYWAMASKQLSSTSGDWADVYQFFDGHGAATQVFYDGTGSGPWTTQITEYDNMGRTYRTTNPFYDGGYGGTLTGLWTTNTNYDHLGRVTDVTMPTGNTGSGTAAVNIAFSGVYTTITDQSGKVRRQKVDELGNVIRLDEPTTSGLGTPSSPNQATNYYYDVLGNLVHVNQGAQDRYFKYDALSRLIRERQVEQSTNSNYDLSDSLTSNSSWTKQISYNSSGLVTEADDARGIRTQLTYDGLNRVTQIEYKTWGNSAEGTPTAHYYYDSQTLPTGHPSYSVANSNGRLIAMTYGSGATGNYFNYDTLGRVVSQWQVTGSSSTTYAMSYAYNYAGMLTSETYPSSRVMSYAYGTAGKLSSVGDGTTTFASSFSYAPNGGLTSETWGNTAVHDIAYNHAQQASQVKLTLGSNVLQQYDYDYGEFNASSGAIDTTKNNGQIGKITATISGTAQWNQGFSYDELGRVSNIAEHQGSSMSTSTYSQGFSYDRYGNKTQNANSTLGLSAVSTSDYDTTNNNNRFVSSVALYDNAGNLTGDKKFRLDSNNHGLTFAYDANGRQTSVVRTTDNTTLQTAVYDCAGQRVQTADGTTRTMVYDIFGRDIGDYTGSTGGTLERENIYRGGRLLATYQASGSAIKYVLQDMQGSTRAMMDNNGGSSVVYARHDYLPFGEEISSGVGSRSSGQGYGVTDTNRQKYGMTERDETTGLDHTAFRTLESRAGRWTSPDPVRGSMTTGDPQSFNHYSYVQNDPVNFVDPSGLSKECILFYSYRSYEGETDDGTPIIGTTIILEKFCYDSGPMMLSSNTKFTGDGGLVVGSGNGAPQPKYFTDDLTPAQKQGVFERAKSACLQRKQFLRAAGLDEGRVKRTGRAMLVGCAVEGAVGAVVGGVAGTLVGGAVPPLEPATIGGGIVVGGILGCAQGALTAGLLQITVFEAFERHDASRDAAKDDADCTEEAKNIAQL